MPYSTKPKDLQDGIATASVKEVGLQHRLVNEILEQIKNGTYPNRHSLLIYKDHKLVLEKYFSGEDQVWGHHIGYVSMEETFYMMCAASQKAL